jgi:hypothetical protein
MKLDPSAPPKLRETDMEEVPRTIFYIGGESLGLTNLLITHSDATVRLLLSPFTKWLIWEG